MPLRHRRSAAAEPEVTSTVALSSAGDPPGTSRRFTPADPAPVLPTPPSQVPESSSEIDAAPPGEKPWSGSGAADQPTTEAPLPAPEPTARSRASAAYAGVGVGLAVLILVLIFIIQNLNDASVHYLGLSFRLPVGLLILIGVVAGGVIVLLVSLARVTQLRVRARRSASSHHLSR